MSFFGLGRPTHEQFAKLVVKAAAEAGSTAQYEYNAEEFTLRAGKTLMNLNNVYQSYCHAERRHKQAVIANFVGAIRSGEVDELLTLEQVKDNLVAVVRERAMLSSASLWWQLEFDEPSGAQKTVQRPLSDWFARAIAIDYPTHVTLVTHDQLTEWGVTFEEAWAFGLENLRNATVQKFQREGGLFIGTWKDDYDASRILLPELLDRLELDGDPVVTLPNRQTILVAGANDFDAIRAMLARAEKITQEEPRPYNPSPLVVRNETILDFKVGEGSPIFNEVQRARGFAGLLYYQDQKAQLEKLYEKKGKDIFVASYSLNQRDSGKYVTYCTWSKDVPSLLPTTDVVLFVDPDIPKPKGSVVVSGTWEQVQSIVGDLMLDTKMFPSRHYVSKFPTAEQLQKLGMRGLD